MNKFFNNLDMFGSSIEWRILRQEKQRSIFGALISLAFIALFIFKFIVIINKINDFGFAKNQISYQFKPDENFQLINFTDFHMIVYSPNLHEIVFPNSSFHQNKTNITLSQFIDFPSINKDKTSDLVLFDCNEINNQWEEIPLYERGFYICMKLSPLKNILNVTRMNMLGISSNKGKKISLKVRILERLFLLLDETDIDLQIRIMIKNFFLFPKNFTLRPIYSTFDYSNDLEYKINLAMDFRKISVKHRIEFDTLDFNVFADDKYEFNENSLRVIKTNRKKLQNYVPENYIDEIEFQIDSFENINDIIYFTLDDVLSVMGGFIQITFSMAEFIARYYNYKKLGKKFNAFYLEKFLNYDKIFHQVRENYLFQMKFLKCSEKNKRNSRNKLQNIKENKNSELRCKTQESLKATYFDDLIINNLKNFKKEINTKEISKNINFSYCCIDNSGSSRLRLGNKKPLNNKEKQNENMNLELSKMKYESTETTKLNKKDLFGRLMNMKPRRKSNILNRSFDFFEYIDINNYIDLLSGFEAFKFLFFNKIGKNDFEKLSSIFIFSKNCDLFHSKSENIDYVTYFTEEDLPEKKMLIKSINNLELY